MYLSGSGLFLPSHHLRSPSSLASSPSTSSLPSLSSSTAPLASFFISKYPGMGMSNGGTTSSIRPYINNNNNNNFGPRGHLNNNNNNHNYNLQNQKLHHHHLHYYYQQQKQKQQQQQSAATLYSYNNNIVQNSECEYNANQVVDHILDRMKVNLAEEKIVVQNG